MSILKLWFPENFDKKYEKYRKNSTEPKNRLEPFLLERLFDELENIGKINSEAEYEEEIQKWEPFKVILDAINKELSPLANEAQSVKIDLNKIGLSENTAKYPLLTLVQEGVCRWRITSPGIISSVPVAEYLSGDGVVVQDYKKFRDFRTRINEFISSIKKQKEEKFPEMIKFDLPEEEKPTKKKLEKPQEDLPLVEYNTTTGKGKVDGIKKFKFKDGQVEYKVFASLYNKINKKLSRNDVLVLANFYEDYQEPDPTRKTSETACINEIAKTIREKTGLDTDHLVNNNGNLTLVARKN